MYISNKSFANFNASGGNLQDAVSRRCFFEDC